MKRPAIYFSSTLFISLILFNYIGFYTIAVISFFAAVGMVILFFFRKRSEKIYVVLICCFSVMLASLLFSAKTAIEYMPAISLAGDEERTITGEVTEYEENSDRHYYTLKNVSVDGKQIKPQIHISTNVYRAVSVGDRVSVPSATIYALGQNTGTAYIYKADGIYIGAYTDSWFDVETPEKRPVGFYLDSIRTYISDKLYAFMDADSAAVAVAILTGNKSGLSDDIQMNFRYAGITHMFAVSGFHLALWTSVISFAFSRLLKYRQRTAAVITILFVIFFMALTGFSKSVVRAGIMMILMQCARLTRFQADSLNSLFLSVGIILLINPFAAMSVALQLSFSATLGIILFSPVIAEQNKKLKKKTKSKLLFKISSVLYSTLAVSIVAALFTIPLSALTFGYYSIASPLTNLLVFIPSELSMLLAGIGVLTAEIGAVSKPILLLCKLCVRSILLITDKTAHLPYVTIQADSDFFRLTLIIAAIAFIVCMLRFADKYKKMRIASALMAAVITVLSVVSCITDYTGYKITVAAVGNGTAVIYRHHNKNVLIGCGGGNHSEYYFTNELDKCSERSFDLLLIPREKETESRFAYSVLSKYNIDKVILPTDEMRKQLEAKLPFATETSREGTFMLDENTTLVYIDNDDFSGARISADGFTCTVLFMTGSDFSVVPDEWQIGDVLITRQNLPNINIDGFDTVLVSTSAETAYTQKSIYSTMHSGTLQYKKLPVGGGIVYAAK